MKGEYPERIGQLKCQYYLKTGTYKFGATGKFHHPRDKAGIAGRVPLNVLGYPLQPKRFKVDHANAKAKIMAILNGRWKEWKHNLKSEFFVTGDRATSMSNIASDS